MRAEITAPVLCSVSKRSVFTNAHQEHAIFKSFTSISHFQLDFIPYFFS